MAIFTTTAEAGRVTTEASRVTTRLAFITASIEVKELSISKD